MVKQNLQKVFLFSAVQHTCTFKCPAKWIIFIICPKKWMTLNSVKIYLAHLVFGKMQCRAFYLRQLKSEMEMIGNGVRVWNEATNIRWQLDWYGTNTKDGVCLLFCFSVSVHHSRYHAIIWCWQSKKAYSAIQSVDYV